MKTTGRISDPEQVEALVSPVRQDVLDTLISRRSMSARQLAADLGMKTSAVYYHLDELVRVGLVMREGAVRDDGRKEARYRVEEDGLEIDYRLDDAANRAAVERVVASILRLADRDFRRGFDHPEARGSGPARNLWGARGKARLSRADLVRVNELLAELAELFSRSDDDGDDTTMCAITWVVTPVSDRG